MNFLVPAYFFPPNPTPSHQPFSPLTYHPSLSPPSSTLPPPTSPFFFFFSSSFSLSHLLFSFYRHLMDGHKIESSGQVADDQNQEGGHGVPTEWEEQAVGPTRIGHDGVPEQLVYWKPCEVSLELLPLFLKQGAVKFLEGCHELEKKCHLGCLELGDDFIADFFKSQCAVEGVGEGETCVRIRWENSWEPFKPKNKNKTKESGARGGRAGSEVRKKKRRKK